MLSAPQPTSTATVVNTSLRYDHHLYNHLNDRWIRQTSKRQSFLTLTTTTRPDDYTALGFKLATSQPKTIRRSAMADTGCQSCLASIKMIRCLGLRENDLIPVTMRMHAANNKGIKILCAVILRFSGRSKSSQILETHQIVYVTSDSDKLFLSRETCTALGMISQNFPTVGEALQVSAEMEPAATSDAVGEPRPLTAVSQTPESALTAPCNCPSRQKPPPKPTQPPFPTTEANRKHLQQWLLDYYRSSTFNMCEHQPLPLMEGAPMRLMVNPDAKPVAHHTPVPVPLHWQTDVKAGSSR